MKPIQPVELLAPESHASRIGVALLIGVLAATHLSCRRSADVDMIGEAIEQSGRNFQSRQSAETQLEALYDVDGAWTLLVVPPAGVNVAALARAGLSDGAMVRVRDASAGWLGGQHLVQVRDDALLSRRLDQDAVSIDRQFVVTGQGPAWIVAVLKRRAAKGAPVVVSFAKKPG